MVDFLIGANLVSDCEVRAVRERIGAGSEDAAALLEDLVQRNKLTAFQAERIARGQTQGLVLGSYVLLRPIGRGGMGQIYQAQHRCMKRIVAVKLLSEAYRDYPEAVERFQREVVAAARLCHPNIVTAYDAGEADGQHFLIMEYVEGADLAAVVRAEGPLPVDRVLDYVSQAACGLQFAHEQGIVHRDIKPANLLLDSHGTVKVLDMGLAHLALRQDEAARPSLTISGMMMGTPDFMAPEQAEASKRVDQRADVYSLGCTLAFLLTGQPVYSADSLPAKLLAHREQPIPSLRQRREDVPPALDDLFRKMVAKRPEDRLQSMAEVLAALQSGIASVRVPTPERAARSAVRPAPPPVADGMGRGGPATAPAEPGISIAPLTGGWAETTCRRIVAGALLVLVIGGLLVAGAVQLAERNSTLTPPSPAPASLSDTASPAAFPGSAVRTLADWVPTGSEWSVPADAEIITIDALGGQVAYFDRILRSVSDSEGSAVTIDFRLIPDPAAPFYLMENKVWNDLFRTFAEQYPDRLSDSSWRRGAVAGGQYLGIEGSFGRLPVVGVPIQDACEFAAWLGGHLPTADQWDKAAGRYGKPIGKPCPTDGGPFRTPGAGPPRVAVRRELQGPEPVDAPLTDDISPWGCRHMAGNGLELTRNLFSGRLAPVNSNDNDHVHLRGRSYDDPQPLHYRDFDRPESFGTQGYGLADPYISFRVAVEVPRDGGGK